MNDGCFYEVAKRLNKDIKCISFNVEYKFIAKQWATGVEELLEGVHKSKKVENHWFRWFGHVSRMLQERFPKQTLYAKGNGKK